jgi:alpha-tubulin suppressor-like RCC1 family protein
VRSPRVLVGFALVVFGCGSRSGLSVLDLASGVGAESPGDPSVGGSSASGGASTGVGKGGTSSQGGAGGASVGGAGIAMGGAWGGEPSAGGSGEAGSPGEAGRGGEGGSGGDVGSGGGGEPPQTSPVVELALGAFTSCAGLEDGGLRCWGTGGYIGSGSKLTIGDNETPDVLPRVAIGDAVTQISSSWYHTCTVLASGSLRCFGNGISGMLGYGDTEHIGDDETPASAGDVNVGGRVRHVATGAIHSCAVLQNGKVRCWGRNDQFQLGYADGATIGDDESPALADFVDLGGHTALRLAAGYVHTCALIDTNEVICWGQGTGGRLGYGNQETIGDDEDVSSAGSVDVGGEVIQIGAGSLHTCALLATGNVRCWGAAADGQLGYGNHEYIGDDETPAAAGDVDIGGKVVQIAVGDYATCALLESGGVRCWGSGEHGELGYGNTENIGDDETPADAGDVPLGAKATLIDVGFLHACALLETGAVRCWGRADPGCLGYGNKNDIGDNETPASAGDVKLQ